MPVKGAFNANPQVYKPPFPFKQTFQILHDHCEVMGTADARMAFWRAGPLKEGDYRARVANLVAKVEVVAAGVVKVDGLLYKALTKHLCIEIDGALGI